MSQLLVKTGVFAVFALALLPSPALAAEPLEGRFRGALGDLRFETDPSTGEVVGAFESGGECSFLPGQAVIDGALEGDVFVGRVLICQTGTLCEPRFYPLMAFVDREEGTFSGMVKLDTGCNSLALQGPPDRKVLTLARDGSGTQLAKARLDRKTEAQAKLQAKRAFDRAAQALVAKPADYRTAKARALEAISLNRNHAEAYLALGVAEMKLNNPHAAIAAYNRSAALDDANSVIWFDLACAYARLRDRDSALKHLTRAVELGFNDGAIKTDRDLMDLFANDPDYKRLVERAESNAPAPRPNGRQGGR